MDLAASLPLLLQLFWTLATGAVLVTLSPLPVPQAFKDAVRLSAARGKLWMSKPKALGALGEVSVPQSWFAHFYAVGAACNGLLLLALAGQPGTSRQLLFLSLLHLHLCRRLAETLFLMVYPPHARMHVIACLFGLVYYLVVPLSLLEPQTLQSLAARLLLGRVRLLALRPAAAAAALALAGDLRIAAATASPLTWLGCAVFLGGNLLQLHSHWTLARLASKVRSRSRSGPGTVAGSEVSDREASTNGQGTAAGSSGDGDNAQVQGLRQRPSSAAATAVAAVAGPAYDPAAGPSSSSSSISGGSSNTATGSFYRIPHGGAFELVSCPHYLGEVVVYLGLVLLTGGQSNTLLMLAWVTVNLVLAADATQKWYHATFPSYPRRRRALVPFVW